MDINSKTNSLIIKTKKKRREIKKINEVFYLSNNQNRQTNPNSRWSTQTRTSSTTDNNIYPQHSIAT